VPSSPSWVRDLVIGYLAGTAGTAAMTTTTEIQKRIRRHEDIPVDYDATKHVVTAASAVVRFEPRSHGQATALFLVAHWGYGSAVAIGHRALLRRTSRPEAAVVFFAGCQAMAFVLLPVLGGTPPPWRWRRDILVSSLAHHVVYVAAVVLADSKLASATDARSTLRARVVAQRMSPTPA
jgi:hypothetical protein